MRVEFNSIIVIYDALLCNLHIWTKSRSNLNQIWVSFLNIETKKRSNCQITIFILTKRLLYIYRQSSNILNYVKQSLKSDKLNCRTTNLFICKKYIKIYI